MSACALAEKLLICTIALAPLQAGQGLYRNLTQSRPGNMADRETWPLGNWSLSQLVLAAV